MTERVFPEAILDASRQMAQKYLSRAKEFNSQGKVSEALGLHEDLTPVFIGACAKTMLEYDIDEQLELFPETPSFDTLLASPLACINPHTRRQRNTLLMSFAIQILEQADKAYIENIFGENTLPPELKHLPFAARELFALLHVSATSPHQNIPVQQRFEVWAQNWKIRMSNGM